MRFLAWLTARREFAGLALCRCGQDRRSHETFSGGAIRLGGCALSGCPQWRRA